LEKEDFEFINFGGSAKSAVNAFCQIDFTPHLVTKQRQLFMVKEFV